MRTKVGKKYYPILITIGLNIKYIREQQKLLQEQLSNLIGIDEKTISPIESRNNPYSMSLHSLLIIVNVLNVPIAKIFEVRD